MPKINYVSVTIERLPKKAADKVVRSIVEEFGAMSIIVTPYQDPQPEETPDEEGGE